MRSIRIDHHIDRAICEPGHNGDRVLLIPCHLKPQRACVRVRMLRNPSTVWVSAKDCALSYSAILGVTTRRS